MYRPSRALLHSPPALPLSRLSISFLSPLHLLSISSLSSLCLLSISSLYGSPSPLLRELILSLPPPLSLAPPRDSSFAQPTDPRLQAGYAEDEMLAMNDGATDRQPPTSAVSTSPPSLVPSPVAAPALASLVTA